ncbi:hypothetical protein E2562_016955 [Oryza meyeriana var. granulata]|uniref:Peptidyl-prolyl cis-trans isomerase n=1 Tax=Oryza meyeriana var. granulata TaxID=110450 RepID=A0A6G1DXD8_9ORYZ|nr:hypothetical protein E2562_016955 [Oryza meyeriana var. granulata]
MGVRGLASWWAAASAGSAPAQALATKHGVGDVLVTEARSRPGGNIITTVERAEGRGGGYPKYIASFSSLPTPSSPWPYVFSLPSPPTYVSLARDGMNAAYDSGLKDDLVTSKVYFDVTIDGKPAGQIVMGLFGNTVPKIAENFRAICTGEKGVGKSGKPLYYKGTTFHRIIPGFMIQGGDTTNELGRSNRLLIMGYSLCCCYRLDGKHVVFGKVLSGMDVVYKIEAEGTQTGAPRCKVVISDSGELK